MNHTRSEHFFSDVNQKIFLDIYKKGAEKKFFAHITKNFSGHITKKISGHTFFKQDIANFSPYT
jgi:hypothetical protein